MPSIIHTLFLPRTAFGRIAFAFVATASVMRIGHNLHGHSLYKELVAAIQARNYTQVQSLLARAPLNDEQTVFAFQAGHLPLLSLSLSASGGTLRRLQSAASLSPDGLASPLTRLDAASERIACLLVQQGASRPLPSALGTPYLVQACDLGSPALVRSLLERGINPNADLGFGTALDHAIRYTQAPPGAIFPPYGNARAAAVSSPGLHAQALERQNVGRQMVQLLRAYGAQMTPMQAAAFGDKGALTACLEAGISVDACGADGRTALWAAAAKNDLAMMRLLYSRGADVNHRSASGGTVLQAAIAAGHVDAVRWLLAHGTHPDVQTLRVEALSRLNLLQSDTDLHRLERPAGTEASGWQFGGQALDAFTCPLAQALYTLPTVVPDLLRAGANVNGTNGEPLRAALRMHRLSLVRELLRRGVQVNPSAQNAEALLASAFAEARSGQKRRPLSALATALFYAPECEALLRRAGAGLTVDKHMALSLALDANRADLLPKLLRLGAEADGERSGGQTPLNEAIRHAPSAIPLLLKQGANPNVRDREWNLPLMEATLAGQTESVRVLLAHGAEVNVSTSQRFWTPLYFARKYRHQEIALLLQQAGANEERIASVSSALL